MTVYSVIYTRTDSHNLITETQVKGIYLDHTKAVTCFNSTKLQIKYNDPKYKVAEKENTIKWDNTLPNDYEFALWVDSTGVNDENGETYSDYYEVTLRIIQSTICK